LSHATLAVGELTRKNVGAAVAEATTVVHLASTMSSSRCREAVRDLRSRFRPYPHEHEVQQFNVLADDLLGLPA
jgi:hypothetical protein